VIRAKDGSQLAEARGHVEALNGPYRLTCDNLVMADDKREGTATGKVELTRAEEGLRLSGRKLVYHEDLKRVRMEGEPVLTKVDAEGRTTTARGRLMTFDEEARRGEILGDVRITQGELTATAGKAVYDAGRDVLVLTDGPSAVQGANEIRGESMTIHVETKKLVVEGRVTGAIHGEQTAKSIPEHPAP